MEAMDLGAMIENGLIVGGDLFDGIQPPGSLAEAELD
jgi:hypothetical protein